jgi:ABC-type branched-subunit amino acid transport system ATPase component
MARTFQNSRLLQELTVHENVLLPLATLFPLAEARRRASARLDDFGLAGKADLRPSELSTADRKVVELCRALAAEPRLLLLDEIFSGLAEEEIHRYLAILLAANRRGITLLLVEHLMRVVRQVAQRVLVMNYGRLIAGGQPDAVLADPTVVEAYLGKKLFDARH